PDVVVERADDPGGVGAVPVVVVVAPSPGAVGAARHVEVGVLRVDPGVEDGHVDVHPGLVDVVDGGRRADVGVDPGHAGGGDLAVDVDGPVGFDGGHVGIGGQRPAGRRGEVGGEAGDGPVV